MRCQVCQVAYDTVGACGCGKLLCWFCAQSVGCCGKKPAVYTHMIVKGVVITPDNDSVDEDGDRFEEPTPTVEIEHDPDWHETGGES